jgi:RNA polymerase sigma factor (sigma-70 family)
VLVSFYHLGVSTTDLPSLLSAAGAGDQRAFDELVARFGRLVWSVARSFRLDDAAAADVSQTTWLRFVEQLHAIRDPERVGAWLATTARREALATLRRNGRAVPSGLDGGDGDAPDVLLPAPDQRLLDGERDRGLWSCFAQLSARCQALLRVLTADPPPTYEEVAAALDMPVGSIGPTRGRCLDRLSGFLEEAGISAPRGRSRARGAS